MSSESDQDRFLCGNNQDVNMTSEESNITNGNNEPSSAGTTTTASSETSSDTSAGQSLIEFLQYLEDYKSSVPDAVVTHFLSTAGFNTTDPRVARLVAIAGQKFIADIANDALQHCKIRSNTAPPNKKAAKEKRYTLTFDDLSQVLADIGVDVKKPQYYF